MRYYTNCIAVSDKHEGTDQMTLEQIKAAAYAVRPWKCIADGHDDCIHTFYFVATIVSNGSDKSHALMHQHHSSNDSISLATSPDCGSKRWGSPHSFKPVAGRPTCGRC